MSVGFLIAVFSILVLTILVLFVLISCANSEEEKRQASKNEETDTPVAMTAPKRAKCGNCIHCISNSKWVWDKGVKCEMFGEVNNMNYCRFYEEGEKK